MVSLLKCVSCIILHSSARHGLNKHSNFNNKNNSKFFILTLLFAIWSFMTLAGLTLVHGAAVYSNADIYVKPTFEQICNPQEEHFIESDGKESSLIVEFNSKVLTDKRKSCTRILSAPANYGFILRLILPKMRRNHHNTAAATSIINDFGETDSEKPRKVVTSALNEMTTLIEKLNATALKTILGRTCPLSVFSSLDPHTPQWRVDPCQLEDTAPEMEDPVRLFHGRVRIVWEHADQKLNSKLMITALGKGEQCRAENKHPCLKIGDEPLLCISKDLVCDGIRHCPNSNEYDTDEDYSVCWKRRHLGEALPTTIETDLFEHFALEVFRNLFLFDVPTMPTDVLSNKEQQSKKSKTGPETTVTPVPLLPQSLNVTTLRKVTQNAINGTDKQLIAGDTDSETLFIELIDNSTDKSTTHHRRNNTRHGLHSDLSKYGPWGYLMLGMLLCGGALLICGLWASASQQAANNEREAALASAAAANGISIEHSSAVTSPPNYEELDPPPAYSVLFPNQKSASSATITAMDAEETTTTSTMSLSPSSRPACSGTAGLALRMTIAQPVIATITPSASLTTTTTTSANNSALDSQIPN